MNNNDNNELKNYNIKLENDDLDSDYDDISYTNYDNDINIENIQKEINEIITIKKSTQRTINDIKNNIKPYEMIYLNLVILDGTAGVKWN